jgi:hypothetical protein
MRTRKMLYVAIATAFSLGVGGAQAVDGGGTRVPLTSFAGTLKCHATLYPFDKMGEDLPGIVQMRSTGPEGQFCMVLQFEDPEFGFLMERPYCGRYFPESLTMYKGRLGFSYAYGTFGGMSPIEYYFEGGEGGNQGIGGSETGQLKLTEDAKTGLLKLEGKSWAYMDTGDSAATAECEWRFKESPPVPPPG